MGWNPMKDVQAEHMRPARRDQVTCGPAAPMVAGPARPLPPRQATRRTENTRSPNQHSALVRHALAATQMLVTTIWVHPPVAVHHLDGKLAG
jgi:hypothetical protein